MLTRNSFRVLLGCSILAFAAQADVVSRVTTFSDGSVLFAADLDSEFNNLVNNVNSLTDDNISSLANISPVKIAASIQGSGLSRNGATGALSVSTDNVGIEISSNNLQLKANGVAATNFRQSAGLSVVGNATNATANVTDITAATDGHVLRRSGTSIGFGTIARTALPSVGQQISSSSGTFSSSAASRVDVTNLSVSITTTGRPVMLRMQDDGSGSGSYVAAYDGSVSPQGGGQVQYLVYFMRGATDLTLIQQAGLIYNPSSSFSLPYIAATPCSSFSHLDVPAAGTYTYKIQVNSSTTSATRVYRCKLVAFEL